MHNSASYVLLCCILLAAKDVISANILRNSSVWVVVFWIYLFAMIVSWLLVKNKALLLRKIAHHAKEILSLNILCSISFLGFMIALKYIEPSIVDAMSLALGPLVVHSFTGCFSVRSLTYSFGLVAAMAWLIYISAAGYSSLGEISAMNLAFGCVGVIGAAFGLNVHNIQIKKMQEIGWKNDEIVASRYFLLCFGSGIAMYLNTGFSVACTKNELFSFFILALLGNIIPLMLIVRAVQAGGPALVAYLMPIKMILTFLFEKFDKRHEFSLASFASVAFVFVFIVSGTLLSAKRQQMLTEKSA